METYDVVVVGGGAAGLAAAVALARARRSVLVLDAGEPRNAPAHGVHNLLGHDGLSPADLLARGRAEVERYGGSVVPAGVSSARRQGDGFVLERSDGASVRARRLLVTTGLVDELPDVPGLRERWGRDVLHCPYCHGYEVRDHPVGVLATTPLAVHSALLCRQWTSDLVLFLHTAPEPAPEQLDQLVARGIVVVRGEVAGLEVAADALAGVRLADGRLVARTALVVASQVSPRPGLLDALGLVLEDVEMAGVVVGRGGPADAGGATAVPGVRVAGNVTDPVAQVATAAAQGLWAGAQLNAELVAEDTARAVAAMRAA